MEIQGRIQKYLEGGGQLYSVRHIHTDKRVLNADGIPHLPLCLTVSNELINKIINCYAKIVYLLKYLVSGLMAASCSLHCYKLRKCMCACSVYPMVVIERNCNRIARLHVVLCICRGWRGGGGGGGVLTPLDPPLNPPLRYSSF